MGEPSAFDPADDFDDDWQEIERASNKVALPDATVMLSDKPRGRFVSATPKAYATLTLRGEPAKWAFANAPRFRLQIGGKDVNKIRLTPDAQSGQFEVRDMRGTAMLSLGHINLWPNEARAHTEAKVHIAESYLVLTLPQDFARAQKSAPLPGAQPPKPARSEPVVETPKPVAPDEDARVLRAALGLTETFPRLIGGVRFTPQEAGMLEVLLARSEVSRESFMIATRDPAEPGDDERDPKIIDVLICKLRPKLEKLGIGIAHEWGGAFRMNAESKGRLRRFVEKARADRADDVAEGDAA